jgi:hypothetical protein
MSAALGPLVYQPERSRIVRNVVDAEIKVRGLGLCMIAEIIRWWYGEDTQHTILLRKRDNWKVTCM